MTESVTAFKNIIKYRYEKAFCLHQAAICLQRSNFALILPPSGMQVHQKLEQLPKFNKAIVTIGTFDGIHLGHRKIIEQMKREAMAVGGETVIITFHPHPRKVVKAGQGDVKLLTTMQERIRLLSALGIDHLVVIPFTEEFARMEASDYITEFLVRRFNPQSIIIGYDHRFGRDRLGNYHLLEELAPLQGYKVKEIDEQVLYESAISSTRIREALAKGNLHAANGLLGYAFFFEGTVVNGNQRGRLLGYPTANLVLSDPDKLLPQHGVYAVTVEILDGPFKGTACKGMMNLGFRPTVAGKEFRVEVHLFGFEGDLYGLQLRVSVFSHIRDEHKFSSLEALTAQLAKDKLVALGLLADTV
jgi:riboflavin kinase / FMN adenylyltransferase